MTAFPVSLPQTSSFHNAVSATDPVVPDRKTQAHDALAAWLESSARRLDTRAECVYFDRAERDRLLMMAEAADQTAIWLRGGAR